MHAPRFSQLDRLLTATREYWQFMPFSSSPSQWEQSHPELTKWLLGLDEAQLAHYKENPD